MSILITVYGKMKQFRWNAIVPTVYIAVVYIYIFDILVTMWNLYIDNRFLTFM